MIVTAWLAAHLATGMYIAWHDLHGKWENHRLGQRCSTRTITSYTKHLPSIFIDIGFGLWPALVIFACFYEDALYAPLLPPAPWPYAILTVALLVTRTVVNNVTSTVFAGMVHWMLHAYPSLYRCLHKRHHVPMVDMTAFVAWQDSFVEFIFTEILGTFLLGHIIFGTVPWQLHVLSAAYNGFGSAIDHSGFYIPGSWFIDGRYHFMHHINPKYHMTEFELLDRALGTLHSSYLKPSIK